MPRNLIPHKELMELAARDPIVDAVIRQRKLDLERVCKALRTLYRQALGPVTSCQCAGCGWTCSRCRKHGASEEHTTEGHICSKPKVV